MSQTFSDMQLSTCPHVSGDDTIPTSRSDTANEVNIFAEDVIL